MPSLYFKSAVPEPLALQCACIFMCTVCHAAVQVMSKGFLLQPAGRVPWHRCHALVRAHHHTFILLHQPLISLLKHVQCHHRQQHGRFLHLSCHELCCAVLCGCSCRLVQLTLLEPISLHMLTPPWIPKCSAVPSGRSSSEVQDQLPNSCSPVCTSLLPCCM